MLPVLSAIIAEVEAARLKCQIHPGGQSQHLSIVQRLSS